jgi:hypothetical protein
MSVALANASNSEVRIRRRRSGRECNKFVRTIANDVTALPDDFAPMRRAPPVCLLRHTATLRIGKRI